jgi:hypothetical protein
VLGLVLDDWAFRTVATVSDVYLDISMEQPLKDYSAFHGPEP